MSNFEDTELFLGSYRTICSIIRQERLKNSGYLIEIRSAIFRVRGVLTKTSISWNIPECSPDGSYGIEMEERTNFLRLET